MTIPISDEWIKISSRDELPKDRTFLALKKGAPIRVSYNEKQREFCMFLGETIDMCTFWRDMPCNPEHENPDRSLKDD